QALRIVPMARQILIVNDLHAARFFQQLLIVREHHPHFFSDLRLGWRAHQTVAQSVDGLLYVFGLAAHAAWKPVLTAQFVQHGTAETVNWAVSERRIGGRLGAPNGDKQAHHAGLHKVDQLYAGRQLDNLLQSQAANQRGVLADKDIIASRHAANKTSAQN